MIQILVFFPLGSAGESSDCNNQLNLIYAYENITNNLY
jgi:hypothetical protein